MSLAVIPSGLIVIDNADKAHFIPFVCAVYDLVNMTMWRVERKNGNIFAQKLDEWLADNINVSENFFFSFLSQSRAVRLICGFSQENGLSKCPNVWSKGGYSPTHRPPVNSRLARARTLIDEINKHQESGLRRWTTSEQQE
jgi:hypothetical protein